MKNIKSSLFAPLLMVSLLGMGVTACSNPKQDAEVREEPAESASMNAQDKVQADAIEQGNIENNSSAPVVDSSETKDAGEIEAPEAESIETDSVGNNQIGTHDNDDIIDGTDEEEHVSTY